MLKIAATLLILIGIGTVIKLGFYRGQNLIIVSTINRTKQEIKLADGSVVYLNRGSKLKYPEKFTTATREIDLEGEAFFKVAKDSIHPFIVHAKGTNTRVLGTSFNINTKNPGQVKISVFSGKVVFRPEGSSKQELKLIKDESGVFNQSNLSLTKQIGANDNAIAWQTGILKFNKTTLAEATRILSGYYSQTIEVAPQLQNRFISVTFDNQPLDKTLEILELTLGIKVDKTSEKIMLKPL
jgi:ferric-dicitrate binding protein FerR (iron transport regulator)